MNLRKRVERDLARSLEGAWGLPVELVAPDGTVINTRQGDGAVLVGQVLYDYLDEDPSTGQTVVVNEPVVTLRLASLSMVPSAGENWVIRITETPDPDASLVSYGLSDARPPEGGKSIGYIRLYLQKLEQV